jgi:hypothetical protein
VAAGFLYVFLNFKNKIMKNLKRKVAFAFAVLGLAGAGLMFSAEETKAGPFQCWYTDANPCSADSGVGCGDCGVEAQ